jgi:hypothetical protein
MKRNFSVNHIGVIIIVLFTASLSCKKLVQIPVNPTNEIPSTRVFSDSADLISAVLGIYANFKEDHGTVSNMANGEVTINAGLSADEIITTNPSIQFGTNSVTSTNATVETMWSTTYANIYQINACLAGLASTNVISKALNQELQAEIKVVRAFYCFYMVNFFGGVPVVTATSYQVNMSLPRAPVDSVYSLVISDLSAARQVLTAAYPSTGRARPNLYTADALLAKAYLYRQQWQNADVMASQVINSGVYSLLPDPDSVFLLNSNEAIWQVPAVSQYSTAQTPEGAAFIPYFTSIIPNYQVNAYQLAAFEPGDKRKTDWIATSVVSGTSYYYPFKYKETSAASKPVEAYMFFRLAEQYLIRAEALAQQNKLDSALGDLNIIRARAGLPNSTAVSQTDILNAIMHERQTELFCEWGQRWFDLRRTGAIDNVLGQEKTGWQPNDSLYPIPLSEIQSNPFLTQNAGY